jgi:hypothetical protein
VDYRGLWLPERCRYGNVQGRLLLYVSLSVVTQIHHHS